MIFDAPNGLYYDTAIHDFVEADGTFASTERVATTWGMPVEQVEQDRQDRAARAAQRRARIIAQQASHEYDAFSSKGSSMTPNDYQAQALRTVYPDLTDKERLGLCGLGLSGEIGEVTDLLKKHLYHRSGKPLDVEKMKDELGDVLWYFSVLLSTLGLTFEDVMQANIAKLEARHTNGFTSRYASDSGASL